MLGFTVKKNRSSFRPTFNIKVSDLLLTKGFLSFDQVKIAEIEQAKTPKTFEQIIIDLGFLSATTLAHALAEASGSQPFDLKRTLIDPQLLAHFPRSLAEKHQIFPLSKEADTLNVAMVDPYDIQAIDSIRAFFTSSNSSSLQIIPFVATPSDLEAAIAHYYGHKFSIDALLQELENPSTETTLSEDSPAIRFIHRIFFDAISKKASDIHFEPEHTFVRIRYRMDGKLQQICVLHKQYWPLLCVRLKILGAMDIAEMRLPQDGHLTYQFSSRKIDFRFSVHPTLFGENIVVRILDKSSSLRTLTQLGFDESQLKLLKDALKHPEGMILLTGPTGSGKTTTLYAMLDLLNSPDVNIMTLEEPVEYELPLVRQTSIRDGSHLSFAQGIRSILRQDPDILLIGEIRDETTAQMALRASMTGHLVFSTLHTTDVFGILPRLKDLGLNLNILSGQLVCLVAQRLIRMLCKTCKKSCFLTDEEAVRLGLDSKIKYHAFRPTGCEACHYTGYRGRTVIAEILAMTPDIEDLFQSTSLLTTLRQKAAELGFKPMRENGVHKLLQGETSFDELCSVCG